MMKLAKYISSLSVSTVVSLEYQVVRFYCSDHRVVQSSPPPTHSKSECTIQTQDNNAGTGFASLYHTHTHTIANLPLSCSGSFRESDSAPGRRRSFDDAATHRIASTSDWTRARKRVRSSSLSTSSYFTGSKNFRLSRQSKTTMAVAMTHDQ